MQKLKGFTLLELLVVVAVIGFLSSVSIVALSVSQANARDNQRAIDSLSIIKAAELYTSDFGVPPTQVAPVSLNYEFFTPIDDSTHSLIIDLLGVKTAQAIGVDLNQKSCYSDWGETCPVFQNICGSWPNCYCCGSGGGGAAVCGNGVKEGSEECDGSDFGSESCITQGYDGGTLTCISCTINISSCTTNPQSQCNNDGYCDGATGENIGNCPNDCQIGTGGGGAVCGNDLCEAGETPGSCSQDCDNSSMCYSNGEWSLCCLFGGTYCESTGSQGSGGSLTTGGYFGVCNAEQCQQRYLLEKPAFTCTTDADCAPSIDAENAFVSQSDSNYLAGLKRYIVRLPVAPGHIRDEGGDPLVTEKLNKYWVSTHPEVVRNHAFCIFTAYESTDRNINPYSDVNQMPTGFLDDRWAVLCLR